jgi:FkbM family methyltransferase
MTQEDNLAAQLANREGQLAEALRLLEQAVAGGASGGQWQDLARELIGAVEAECLAFTSGGIMAADGTLRQLRLELVSALAGSAPSLLPRSWTLHLSRLHALLLNCGLRDFPRAPAEDRVFEEISRHAPASTGALLGAMLLARSHELPLFEDVESLPEWMRDRWIAFVLQSPGVFNVAGEAERYLDHLERLTELVHRRWVRARGAAANPAVRALAEQYCSSAKFIQAYFSPRNLRPLFEKRGDILSATLVAGGIQTLEGTMPLVPLDGRKIRLGIFAGHFTPQTETYFTLSHFDHLDRARFDITLYTLHSTAHPLEKYCVSRADRLVVLSSGDFATQVRAAIRRIRDDDLDILLMSTNMTAVTNLAWLLGATRLARIQVASVSSPVTTGAHHVDVMLTAAWNEPEPDAPEHFTEHLELVEGSVNYYSYQFDKDPASIDVSREDLGIPADALVFFSGANFFKILPELSDAWARILAAVPGSVLMLMPFNPNWSKSYQQAPFTGRIRAQLEIHGVAQDRLCVISAVPTRADVHRVIGLADVYLDAYPFAGACSMIDAAIVGVPPVVRRGRVGRSNHAASILRMMGLEELITDTEEHYVSTAVALAGDRPRRERLRSSLRTLGAREIPPWFDTALFSRRVGAAFENLYARYQSHYARLAFDGASLRAAVEKTARRVIGRNGELDELTDIGIVKILVHPFFRSQGVARARRMLDVGACHGAMAEPLLDLGWSVDLVEPDPGARAVLEKNVAHHGRRARIHAVAVGSATQPEIAFHQAAMQGLSGLGDSPFGATARVIRVPCLTLRDFCSTNGIRDLDFLKVDAEGYDFDVLASHDFDAVKPDLVLIEYGTHFPRQTLGIVNCAIADMASRGYGSVVFSYADDGNFKRARWVYRLTELLVDRAIPDSDAISFGNILFYRASDARLLLALQALLESCDRPRETWKTRLNV